MKSNLLVLIVSKGDFFHGIGADYVHKQRHTNVDKNKIQTHTKRTQTETNKTYTTAYNNYYTHTDKKKTHKKIRNKQTNRQKHDIKLHLKEHCFPHPRITRPYALKETELTD